MPNFRINVRTELRGPVFDKAASKAAANRMIVGINDAIAVEAVNRIKQRLGQVLQNPTGFYESRIQVDRRTVYRGVSDGGVVYGGWLEGVSSRNATTRFKGYRTFRTIRQDIDNIATQIAEPLVAQYVREMS